MVLIALPCTDIHITDTNSLSLEISEQNHHQANDLDFCSPFCFCHCCQTLSFPVFFDGLLFNLEENSLAVTFKESKFSSPFSAIWQPPKI